MIEHVAFMTDSEIAIGLLEGTKTSNKYVALTLVGQDLLALIKLQGTTYEFIHVRGHTRDKGNDAADTNADKGNLSSGGRPDSVTESPRELSYESVVAHKLQTLRSEIGTDEAPEDTAHADRRSALETESDDTEQTQFAGWSANTLVQVAVLARHSRGGSSGVEGGIINIASGV
eukprot:SAG25_NODE_231_length_11417_cov_12.831684_10_plen_174_part_00